MRRIIINFLSTFCFLFGEDSVKEEVINLLKAELSQKIYVEKFDITLDHWTEAWEKEKEGTLKVKELKVNKNRFQSEVEGFKKDKKLNGKITYHFKLPVLNRSIEPGEEILEDDITYTEVETDQAETHYITKKEDIVGNTSRCSILKAGIPLLKTQIKAPIVVKKGSVIRVVYEHNSLRVTNKGIALKDATKSEVIPVEIQNQQNKNTKKVIQATVLNAQDARILV